MSNRFRTHHLHRTLTAFVGMAAVVASLMPGCVRDPELYLFDETSFTFDIPMVDLDLEAYWDYEWEYGIKYDWRAEWYYGWDTEDEERWGPIGYTEPEVFYLRRYFTGSQAQAPHTTVRRDSIHGKTYRGAYSWGFWDVLVWNEVETIDGVQSLNFDETSTLDSVFVFTNPSMNVARYQAPRYTRAFYAPEPLFSAYDTGIEINRNLEGFVYDPVRNVYVKKLDMVLEPITYIYLTQVILRHNNNKIVGADGSANLSAMARASNLNTGVAGSDPVTVHYEVMLKKNCRMKNDTIDELVDIAGGKLLTFGICSQNGNRIRSLDQVRKDYPHYMDVTLNFNNGMDTTLVVDVTDQVRRRWKGGVLTYVIDMDTVPVPSRSGGSAFDAVVKDFEDGGTHEFEM